MAAGKALIVTLTTAIGLSAIPLHAQDAVVLTLDGAIARAVETSHRLAEARARESGAQAAVDVRRTADRPTVVVNGGYTRTNHVDEFGVPTSSGALRVIYPDIPDNFSSRVQLAWPIYTGGRADALERAADADARAAGADIQTARADLTLEVSRAYWAHVTARESVRVLEEALARADRHLADVRSRLDVGLVPPNDVLTAEAQRARQQMRLIEATNLREATATDLRRLTGLPLDQRITVTEPLETSAGAPAPAPDGQGVHALVEQALDRRPERLALQVRINGAEARQAAAAAGRLPTVAFISGVDYANPNPRIFPRADDWRESWDLSINASWTLWDSGRTRAEVAEATAVATATRERLAELDTVVAAEVRQRLLDLDSNRAALAAAEVGIRAAAEAHRVVTERFAAGVATSTDVVDAEVALLDAELDRTRALANQRLAEARLDRALGR